MAMDAEEFEKQLVQATVLRKQLPVELQIRQTLWRGNDAEHRSERAES
jgi:hypothetical protein